MSDQVVYLYCLVHSEKKPTLTKAPAGVPGGSRPRALPGDGGWWMIVSDVPTSGYDEASIEKGLSNLDWVSLRALGHEQVVEFAAKLGPLVPMKLFTLFREEARATAHVAKLGPQLEKIRKRIAGCAEWGVRVMYEPKASAPQAPAGKATSGADFLKRKQAAQGSSLKLAKDALIRARELLATLESGAQEAVIRPPEPGAALKLLAEGAYLVPTSKTRSFCSAVEKAAQELAPEGIVVDLTGPWPAYHFVADAA